MDAPSERSDQTGEITISKLFSPLKIRGETLPNRVAYSPMCEYTCDTDGVATDFHKVHLGSKALGGTGLVMAEATAVRPDGRISPSCQGLWNDAQVDALRPITAFISSQGSVPAVQIAHAGRKASHSQPWNGSHYITEDEGGWKVVAPSAIPYDENTGIRTNFRSKRSPISPRRLQKVRHGLSMPGIELSSFILHTVISHANSCRHSRINGPTNTAVRSKIVVDSRSKLSLQSVLLFQNRCRCWLEFPRPNTSRVAGILNSQFNFRNG